MYNIQHWGERLHVHVFLSGVCLSDNYKLLCIKQRELIRISKCSQEVQKLLGFVNFTAITLAFQSAVWN